MNRAGNTSGGGRHARPTLVHETWGDHAALIARSEGTAASVGRVEPQVLDVATFNHPLPLQLGGQLTQVAVAFEAYGELNARGDNAILICHALTGSAHAAGAHEREEVPGWWDPLIGPGKAIDTDRYFVVCSNVLGGCYGTTGPVSIDPTTGRPYGIDFPRYTIRDMVEVQRRLLLKLGVTRLAAVIGGSMGGMQALEWAVTHPEMVGAVVPIAIGARHSAWAIGMNEVARRAIMADPAWQGGRYPVGEQPEQGLGLARAMAMLTYRSFDSLEAKFGRERRFEPNGHIGGSDGADKKAGSASATAGIASPAPGTANEITGAATATPETASVTAGAVPATSGAAAAPAGTATSPAGIAAGFPATAATTARAVTQSHPSSGNPVTPAAESTSAPGVAATRARSGLEALEMSFEIASYLSYQGVKLVERFDANTYIHLTLAMDDYDLTEGRGPLPEVLARASMPALVMGIPSDVLYPEREQLELAELLPSATYARIESPHGHDAFLIEFPQIAARLRRFLREVG